MSEFRWRGEGGLGEREKEGGRVGREREREGGREGGDTLLFESSALDVAWKGY